MMGVCVVIFTMLLLFADGRLSYDSPIPPIVNDAAKQLGEMGDGVIDSRYDVVRTVSFTEFYIDVTTRTKQVEETCYISTKVKSNVDDWYDNVPVVLGDITRFTQSAVPPYPNSNRPPWDPVRPYYFQADCGRRCVQTGSGGTCRRWDYPTTCFYKFGSGIYHYYSPIREVIYFDVRDRIITECSSATKFVFVGWGYGAPIVTFLGMHLYEEGVISNIWDNGVFLKTLSLVTFGSPKFVDSDTATYAEKIFMGNTYRVVYNGDDYVSSSPSSSDLSHIGRHVYSYPAEDLDIERTSISSHYKYDQLYGTGCDKW